MITVEEEERIDAYEAALQGSASAAARIDEFLPPADAPDYSSTLVELLRITLEHEWEAGKRAGIDCYRPRYSALFANPLQLEPLAFEEYRLRCAAGERVEKRAYADRYNIDVASWPDLCTVEAESGSHSAEEAWSEFSRSEPGSALAIVASRKVMPGVGDSFGSFDLLALLGEGAFGRVFLARQQSLAGRLVAVKIVAGKPLEAQKLARLQHGNIMPVYSVHRRGKLSGICMPFLGSTTLTDVIERLQRDEHLPYSAESLAQTVEERRAAYSTFLEDGGLTEFTSDEERPTAKTKHPAPTVDTAGSAQPLQAHVARLMLKLADGLAQAHERGILHRDIKPANILIADDGEPLLLDFNLATEQSGHVARLGGTLPYMSPEQLAQFNNQLVALDGRSDLYALGVVMFECLTARQPFAVRRGPLAATVRTMIEDRKASPPDVRTFNRGVSPGLAAIIARCLQPTPLHRYQSAAELREDLKRHLEDRPLRYASNTSLELAAKWRRRHPRLSSISSVLLIVSCLAAIAGSFWYSREEQFANQVAAETYQAASKDLLKARSLLLVGGRGSSLYQEGVHAAIQGLNHHDVLARPDWFDGASVRRLPSDQQTQLKEEVIETLALLAQGERTDATAVEGPGADFLAMSRLLKDVRRARERLNASGAGSQSNDLKTTLTLASWGGTGDSTAKSISDLETELRAITTRRPREAFGWLALTHLYRLQGRFTEAESAANAAVALAGDWELAWQLRGMTYHAQRRWQDAEDDFSRAIELRADSPTALFNRGLVRQEQGKHIEALADFTAAIEQRFSETRVYFSRARSFRAIGEQARADADLKHGRAVVPQDPLSFVARALSYLPADAEAAERDLLSARQLEPSSRVVLMNLAHVQAEHLQKADEALAVLAEILRLNPADTDALGSRAVLFARLQQREQAVAELAKLLKVEVRPPLAIYQSACVYALLSREQPKLRSQALQLLATSFAMQPSLIKTARSDADLRSLEGDPLYAQLVASSTASPKLAPSRAE